MLHTEHRDANGRAGLGAAAIVEWRPYLFSLSWYRTGTLQMDKKRETSERTSQSALVGSFKLVNWSPHVNLKLILRPQMTENGNMGA